MDNKEYVIISKTAIQKRIDELEEIDGVIASHLIKELKQILSQSTPLIPEIEEAFDEGAFYGKDFINDEILEKDKQYYISNLKLDI